MLKFYSTGFGSRNVSWWDKSTHDVILLTWSIYCATKRLPQNTALSLYHTELMSLNFTHRSTISRRSNRFCTADFTAACYEVYTYIYILSCWKNILNLRRTDVDNEKYIWIQTFHVSSNTKLVNMWCCFVIGVTHFGVFNAICLVGHVGRSDKTKKETENLHSNIPTLTSVAKMSAMLTIDNSSNLT